MRNYQRLAQPTSTLLKQAFVIGIAAYCAITLFPFIKYKSGAPRTTVHAANPPLTQAVTDGYLPSTVQKIWSPDQWPTSVQRINYTQSSKQIAGSTVSNMGQGIEYLPFVCVQPQIPTHSATLESEARTINAINAWITCHNAWSNQIQHRLNFQSSGRYKSPIEEKIIQVLQQMQFEDRKQVASVSWMYTEWKKNSLSYKQRLGFRRSLLTEKELTIGE